MKTIAKIYVGVDVSKKHLDIYFYPTEEALRINNNRNDLKKAFTVTERQ